MKIEPLEVIIRRHIQLPSQPTKKGWYECVHSGCDHGKKGPRAGFRFDEDAVAFHCFNCGSSTTFDPDRDENMPYEMRKILRDFGIVDDEWQPIIFSRLGQQKRPSRYEAPGLAEPDTISLPPTFYRLCSANNDWAEIANIYLTERGIEPSAYPFYLSTHTDVPYLRKWMGRLIIPIYKDKRLIFLLGRDLTGTKQKKYESSATSRDNVIYGFNEIFTYSEKPLFIVEGWFDAFVIDGVAIIGNELSQAKIQWINLSKRRKVYVPDRRGNGHLGAIAALEAGWEISTPDIGNCKDINEAFTKYGSLYVRKTLNEQIASGFEAEAKLTVYCEYEKKNK